MERTDAGTFKKGFAPWNKGKKMSKEFSIKIGIAKTGIKPTKKQLEALDKGRSNRKGAKHTVETKVKMSQSQTKRWTVIARMEMSKSQAERWSAENNYNYGRSYNSIHRWIRRVGGNVKKCQRCGVEDKLHWANKDHKYRRIKKDWLRLCVGCHKKFDQTNPSADHVFIKYKNGGYGLRKDGV